MLFRFIGGDDLVGGTWWGRGVLDWIICVHDAYKSSVPTSWYISATKATTGQ